MNITILLISIFCYIGIAHAINVSRFRNDQENFRTSNKKIINYLFMFILQWVSDTYRDFLRLFKRVCST
jgi:hypothetical protein